MLHSSEPVVIQLVRQSSRVNQSPARRHVALHCSIVQGSAAIQIGEVNVGAHKQQVLDNFGVVLLQAQLPSLQIALFGAGAEAYLDCVQLQLARRWHILVKPLVLGED
jgi:hypothetical protein